MDPVRCIPQGDPVNNGHVGGGGEIGGRGRIGNNKI